MKIRELLQMFAGDAQVARLDQYYQMRSKH